MAITESQAEAYLLGLPTSPNVIAEVEKEIDDPQSTVSRLAARYAAVARRIAEEDGWDIHFPKALSETSVH